MQVQLVSWTPDPELLSAAAARLCYRDISAIDLMVRLTPEDIDHLLDVTISSGHHSVIEHVSFTFAIDGVSRVLTHQLVRHRVGVAFSQQSQRFARLDQSGHVTPPSIAAKPEAKARYDQHVSACFALYRDLVDVGVSKEDARFVLPGAVGTRIVMTANLRQLIHMYGINACLRSQWEFRQLMRRLKSEVMRVAPRLGREMKIKCFAMGYCDEAVMCTELAGKMPRKQDVLESYERGTRTFYQALATEVGEA